MQRLIQTPNAIFLLCRYIRWTDQDLHHIFPVVGWTAKFSQRTGFLRHRLNSEIPKIFTTFQV